MHNTIVAKYYDGLSSASQQATVYYNEKMTDFRLQTADGNSVVWELDDLKFERYNGVLELRNKNYSGAILKIEDHYFSERFYESMELHSRVDIHTRLMSLGFTKIAVIAICMLGLIVLSYFYVLPPIAEKSAALLPESFDNYIGDTFIGTFLVENNIDKEKTKYLKQFAAELDLANNKPLKFTVVESNEVNAFALPNGHIVVFSAIIDNMQSPNELAALLGHEASHVNERHSTKMLCRNLAGYMLVSLLLSDVNGIMAVVADNAHQLHSLSYSRKFEQEADEQGLKILMNNHLNPQGMVELFEQLESESEFDMPQIISSHPLTENRKKNMQKIISKSDYKVKENKKLTTIFVKLKN